MSQNNLHSNRFPPALSGFLIALLIFSTGMLISYFRFQVQKQSEEGELRDVMEIVEQNIQRTISEAYSAALFLALTVQDNGEVKNFETYAENLLNNHEGVDVLQLVPDGVIQYVYPYEGNEAVIGYNILADPKVNREVIRATETRTVYFAGPFELKQGGMAVIGRIPVIIEDELWGLSAVIVYLSTMIEQSGINEFSDKYYFQLGKTNPNTGIEEFFMPGDKNIEFENGQSVNFPEGEWKLYAAHKNVSNAWFSFIFIGGFSLVGAVLCGFMSYKLFRKPYELEDLIEEQSRELLESREQFKESSELLTSVLESPQNIVIFSLDRNYNYMAFNENHRSIAQDLFGVPIKKGMNIFDVVPKKARALLMVNYNRALNGEAFELVQETVDAELNVQYWQNWFSPIRDKQENIIGLTVFSIDITQRVEAEQTIERNERRLRTLISNSPYCIHELDTEGRLISINEAGAEMFKMDSPESYLGRYYFGLMKNGYREKSEQLFNRTLLGESTEFGFDDGENYFESLFIPLRNDDNVVTRVMGITQDVTQRKHSESFVENSLREKTTLLAEIHHRVKNNLAIVSGLLELQKGEVDDERLTAIFDQSINRIISIAMVHELMYNTQDLSSINVHDYLEKLVPAISATMQNRIQNVDIDIDIEEYRLNINQAIPLGLLLNELFTNSFKYAFKDRDDNRIRIKLVVDDEKISAVYADNGRGFPADVDFEKPKNLGLNLIHAQLQQLDAEYEAKTKDKFELVFHFSVQGRGSHSNIN
ncbi:MAG: PAS domain-containing protein [Balneolaceae bacterium]|nr:PAS domain-containing protein [Balneolaceae bacterium]